MKNAIANLFGKGAKAPAAFSTPSNTRIYAIGDIHGRADLLKQLFIKIDNDKQGYDGAIEIVFIGDYIDRGPESAKVVEMVRAMGPRFPKSKIVTLRGNHEQAMLDFLADPNGRPDWLHWGGIEAMQSYGIDKIHSRSPESLAAELNHLLTDNGDLEFFKQTVLSYISGDYLFVHAGVRPQVPLKRQIDSDLLFIRDDFIKSPHGLPYRVVYGHTIMPSVKVESDKIGIDTGAYDSGVLSCVVLEGTDVRILDTRTK